MSHFTLLAAEAFQRLLKISREDLYGVPNDKQTPLSLPAMAQTPYLGYIGSGYKPGGTVLVAVNPGGGTAGQQRTAGDDALSATLIALRDGSIEDAAESLEAIQERNIDQIQTINLRRIVQPALEACGESLRSIALLNAFPYRTIENDPPMTRPFRRACANLDSILLPVLAPRRILILGLGRGREAALHLRAPEVHVVERTNGDRYVCEAAKELFQGLRSQSTQLAH